MTFVTPLFLVAGGALLALPIVLHLIMRRKPRRLEFPALRFIQQKHSTNQRRLRLRHLLLLLLRMAILGLFAMALARPSVKFSGPIGSQQEPVAATLVFDTSMRMGYIHENQTRLEVARQWGDWLLGELPENSEIAVIDTRGGTAGFLVDASLARNRVQRLSPAPGGQPLTAALQTAAGLLAESKLQRREIYVFTDLAQVSWPTEGAPRLAEELAGLSNLGMYVIDVGVDNPSNRALGELRLSSQVLSDRSPLVLSTEISQVGSGGERNVVLYLLVHNADQPALATREPLKRGARIVTTADGRTEAIEFELEALPVGTHQGYVKIEGQDGLACDDRRYFTVEVRPAWRVMIATPPPTDDYAWYLTTALAPESQRKRQTARYQIDVVSLAELANTELDDYSAVFLLDPTPLGATTWKKLGDFAAEGHGLAIFLGENARPLTSFNAASAQAVLAGRIVRQARAPDWDLQLAPRDFQHPMLEWLRQESAVPWVTFPISRYWQMADLAPGVDTLVPYSDGRPAVLERTLGNGRALTITTPISEQASYADRQPWNLVSHSWPAYALVIKMTEYLVGGRQRLNYHAGQTVFLQLDREREHASYTWRGPDGGATGRLRADLARSLLSTTPSAGAGNYRVRAGGRGASGVDLGFSVNLTADETQLTRISEEALAEVIGSTDYKVVRRRNELEDRVAAGRVGRELFSMLILLLVVVLAVEHAVANRFYRE